MDFCKIQGSVVATAKDARLQGTRLLVCQPVRPGAEPAPDREPYLAVDGVGAGPGDLVAVVRGYAAAMAFPQGPLPIDALAVAIIDAVEMGHGRTGPCRES